MRANPLHARRYRARPILVDRVASPSSLKRDPTDLVPSRVPRHALLFPAPSSSRIPMLGDRPRIYAHISLPDRARRARRAPYEFSAFQRNFNNRKPCLSSTFDYSTVSIILACAFDSGSKFYRRREMGDFYVLSQLSFSLVFHVRVSDYRISFDKV